MFKNDLGSRFHPAMTKKLFAEQLKRAELAIRIIRDQAELLIEARQTPERRAHSPENSSSAIQNSLQHYLPGTDNLGRSLAQAVGFEL